MTKEEAFSRILEHGLEENDLTLTKKKMHNLLIFLEMITTWNRVFNLTSILKPHDMVYLHIIDSLIIAPLLQGDRFIDIGSGAGLPGIPLAILNPQQQWTLLDKNSKKTRFLTQVIATLGLTNIEVVHSRSEDYHPNICYDGVLSRAFGSIQLFIEITAHLLCPQGQFFAMKGKYPQEELNDVPEGFIVREVNRLEIKGVDVTRHVIILSKRDKEE